MRAIARAVLGLLAVTLPAEAEQQCLRVRDIASFSQGGREGVEVKTYEKPAL